MAVWMCTSGGGDEYRAMEGNQKKLKENPASVPLYALQIPHGVIQD
jgi:hypothetical protein